MTDQLDDKTYHLLFGIRRSRRYHQHRRRYYEMRNSITIIIAALGGSAAAATILSGISEKWEWIPILSSVIVGLVSTIDLAVGTSRKANLHAELERRFIFLEKQFPHNRNLDDEEYKVLTRDRLDIEVSEPTVLRLLDVICHFELLRSYGHQATPPPIKLWRRKLANSFSQYDYAQDYASKYYEVSR